MLPSAMAFSNLIPDKPAALREIFWVLLLAGRLQACDIGLLGEEAPTEKAPSF